MPARIALVTGASRGLGFALAEALGAQGWHVVAVARTVGGLEDLDDRIQAAGGSATLAPMDITVDEAMAQLCRGIYDRWGMAHLWLHSAIHAAPLAPAGHIDAKDLDRSLATNVKATATLIRMVEPLLRAAPAGAQPATAMFFDDPRAGEKFFGAYGATKSAQIALARSWQAEAAHIGPRVLIEAPQPMRTATRARFFPGEEPEGLAPIRDEAARLLAHL
jgi:NAD(P)-dependent dehydrogenase (short-subunit alcohol dehydrogenase family)